MSVEQVQNFRFLRSLLKELRAFGLNPNQWRLVRIQPFDQNKTFSIYHSKDRDFRMTGIWHQKITGQWTVSDLRLDMF